jgi:hypothetical protein
MVYKQMADFRPTPTAASVAAPRQKAGLGAILKRIERRLEALDMSKRSASLAAGFSADMLYTTFRQFKEGTQKGITDRTLSRLAVTLLTTPEWLMSGVGPEQIDPKAALHKRVKNGYAVTASHIPVLKIAEAGVWREVDQVPPAGPEVPCDPRYPPKYQYAIAVADTSVNRFAQPGDFLIAVDLRASKLKPRPNDLVFVTRTKKSDGSRESTVRRLVETPTKPSTKSRWLLTSESDDQRSNVQKTLVVGNGSGEITEIVAIVIAQYRAIH